MRIFGLALAGVLATTTPMAGHTAGPAFDIRPADQGPASNIVLVSDGGGSSGHSGAVRARQWNGGVGARLWGQNRQYGAWPFYGGPAPTYWVWVPGSAVFDYPFLDWRGPTGGWGNP
jgi:hypothetical protein